MKKILVIRSGSLKYLLPALSYLQEKFPESRIDVLTDPDILETLSHHPLLSRILVYSHIGPFFREQLPQIWRGGYQAKVALFTGEREGRYIKFKVLAHLMPPLHWMIVYDERGEQFAWSLPNWRRVSSHIGRRLWEGRHLLPQLVVWLLSLLLFPFAFLLLIFSTGALLARRLYYSKRNI